MEDLNIKKMAKSYKGTGKMVAQKSGLNKSIYDAAWNQLVRYISNKAECAGRILVLVNPCNTSKMCSGCGVLVEKGRREHHDCPSCGLKMDRDLNAAINILRLGLQSLGLVPLEALRIKP
jgi:putative transposase